MSVVSRDIVVIGGGPAGSSCAIFLARRGYQVTLLERAAFPRVKPCGEYLTPGAVHLLKDDIGILPGLLSLGAVPVTREEVVTHSGTSFSGGTNALACSRAILDDYLLNTARMAGVEVIESFNARTVDIIEGIVVGVTGTDAGGSRRTYRARITVGADGTCSLVARTLRVVRPIKRLQRLALVAHYGQSESMDASDADTVTMHLPNDRSDACCGVGPLCGIHDRKRNINIVVPVSEAPLIAGRTLAYFEERLRRSFPDVHKSLGADAGHPTELRSVGCYGHYTTRAAHPGAVLVGDAATFINPFTGEGVFFGLRSAQLASEAIHGALSRHREVHPQITRYDEARHRDLRPRYLLCDAVQRIVHSPTALTWAALALRRSPHLTDVILRTIGDIADPRDLLKPWVTHSALKS